MRPRLPRARGSRWRRGSRRSNARTSSGRRGCPGRPRRTADTSPARRASASRTWRRSAQPGAAAPNRLAAQRAPRQSRLSAAARWADPVESRLAARPRVGILALHWTANAASSGSRLSAGPVARRGRSRGRSARGRWPAGDDLAPARRKPLVQLELPVVAGERHARAKLADVRRHRLARGHADDQLRVAAPWQRRVHGRGKGAPEAGVDVGDPQPDVGIAEDLDGGGPAYAQSLHHLGAELDQLLVMDDLALDRLAASRLDHRARYRVQAAAVEVA